VADASCSSFKASLQRCVGPNLASSSLNTAFQYISITSFHIIIEDVSNSREITSFLLAYGTLRGVIRLDLLGGQLEEVEDYRITVYVF